MAWYTVDQRLITIKAIYFLTLSAVATLLPYFPIFLTQIGVRQKELAVIYFLIFFMTFFKNAIVGFVADKFQSHKLILILSCICTGPLYASMLAVPAISLSSQPIRVSYATLQCNSVDLINSPSSPNISCDQPLPCHQPNMCLQYTSQICSIQCHLNNNVSIAINSSQITFKNSSSIITYQSAEDTVSCTVSFDCEYDTPPADFTSLTFWLCLVIGVMAALFGSNELMMNDAIALSLLGEDRKRWGRSRLWGSAGYGLSALLVSILIEKLGLKQTVVANQIDYTPAFYIYLLLSLSSGAVAYFHPKGNVAKSSQVITGLKSILQNVRVVSFLFIILVLGFYNGIVMTYAFLYLRVTFHATQINIGLCVLVSVLVEFPIFFIGGWIVEKVGTLPCLYLAMAAYAVRFISYVYIPGPMWAIAVETTHMFTFGLMFTAANMHAGKITTKGYTGTIVGLINGIKWGLGLGLGSLLGGIFADTYKTELDPFGYKILFRCCAVSCGVFLVVFILINEGVIRFLCTPAAQANSDSEGKDVKIAFIAKKDAEKAELPESENLVKKEGV